MEIKLTKIEVDRIKRDFERLYEQKEYSVSELSKGVNYPGHAEADALRYIKNDAKIAAIHNVLLILGLNLWYDYDTGEAHLTDRDRKEIIGD